MVRHTQLPLELAGSYSVNLVGGTSPRCGVSLSLSQAVDFDLVCLCQHGVSDQTQQVWSGRYHKMHGLRLISIL